MGYMFYAQYIIKLFLQFFMPAVWKIMKSPEKQLGVWKMIFSKNIKKSQDFIQLGHQK